MRTSVTIGVMTISNTIIRMMATVRCPTNEPKPRPMKNPIAVSSRIHRPISAISAFDGLRVELHVILFDLRVDVIDGPDPLVDLGLQLAQGRPLAAGPAGPGLRRPVRCPWAVELQERFDLLGFCASIQLLNPTSFNCGGRGGKR